MSGSGGTSGTRVGRIGARLTGVLPDSPGGRLFVLLSFVDAVGTGVFMAAAAVFFVRSVGLSNNQIGAGLTIAGLVGLVASVPVGTIGDRIGAKRLLVVMQYWRASCFVAYAFCTNLPFFVVIASFASVAESVTGALTQALVPEVVGEEQRVRTLALVRSVRNTGFSLGALAAAPLIASGSTTSLQVVVLANAASFVVTGLLLTRVRADPGAERVLSRSPSGPLAALRGFRDWRYAALAALNVVFSVHLTLLVLVIPLWVITATAAPPAVISLLLLVNTTMAVLLQIPLSRRAEDVAGSRALLARAGLALAACCLMMVVAASVSAWAAVALLVLGMVFMTLGEIWQSAAAWTLSYTFAPPVQRVQYLAIFGLSGLLAQDVFGPLLLGGAMVDLGRAGWLLLGTVILLAIPALFPLVKSLASHQHTGKEQHRAAAPLDERHSRSSTPTRHGHRCGRSPPSALSRVPRPPTPGSRFRET